MSAWSLTLYSRCVMKPWLMAVRCLVVCRTCLQHQEPVRRARRRILLLGASGEPGVTMCSWGHVENGEMGIATLENRFRTISPPPDPVTFLLETVRLHVSRLHLMNS